MIPPHLEKLIWEGKARYGHAALGASTNSVITVADDQMLIIYEVIVFSNTSTEPDPQSDDVFSYNINQITFRETKKAAGTNFLIRSEIDVISSAIGTALRMPRGHVKFNPYLIFTEDVIVSYLRCPKLPWRPLTTTTTDAIGLDALTVPNGPSPSKAQTMAATVAQLDYGDSIGSTTIPVNTKYFPSPTRPVAFNGFTFPFTDDTEVASQTDVISNETSGTIPIINVGYVLVDKSIGNNLVKTT